MAAMRAPGTATAGAPPAIGEDGGGLGCFVPGRIGHPAKTGTPCSGGVAPRSRHDRIGSGWDPPPSQLDQGQREARADRQKATMFKSSLMSEIIRFMFEPASCR